MTKNNHAPSHFKCNQRYKFTTCGNNVLRFSFVHSFALLLFTLYCLLFYNRWAWPVRNVMVATGLSPHLIGRRKCGGRNSRSLLGLQVSVREQLGPRARPTFSTFPADNEQRGNVARQTSSTAPNTATFTKPRLETRAGVEIPSAIRTKTAAKCPHTAFYSPFPHVCFEPRKPTCGTTPPPPPMRHTARPPRSANS